MAPVYEPRAAQDLSAQLGLCRVPRRDRWPTPRLTLTPPGPLGKFNFNPPVDVAGPSAYPSSILSLLIIIVQASRI